MDATVVALAMLLAVVMSGWLVRSVPRLLPLPLIQIGLGALIGLTATYRVSLAPDVFFLLFLPPVLFLDAWRIPRDALFREGPRVLQLALGLVVFTVLGVGFAIRWMIPSMPPAVAFALAAVLSPTDAVAVTAIADRCAFPSRLLTILKGEALLNDVSGLVCLRLAISAIAIGGFSIVHTATAFASLAVGGVAVGAATTLIIAWLKDGIASRFGEDPTNQTLISLLIPFVAYLTAEDFGFSGVLAAVGAGLSMGYVESQGHALAVTRVRREVVWDTIQVALNGMIFVLLGEQLPGVVEGARRTAAEAGHASRWWLLAYVIVIGVGLYFLRFVWVWTSFFVSSLRRRESDLPRLDPDWRAVVISTVGGVRGTVTLAGILTLPMTLPDGTGLPARDLAICLAAGAIILSLLVADVVLPRLVGGLDVPLKHLSAVQETSARVIAASAAIRAIERAQNRLMSERPDAEHVAATAARVAAAYRERLGELSEQGPDGWGPQRGDEVQRVLRLVALKAERDAVLHLGATRVIDQGTERRLVREIDLAEAVQQGRVA
jgi:CPA1 family monovalent cation:H+ antiporter